MKNALYGSDHHELCPCAEYEAVLDDALSECECPDGWFEDKNYLNCGVCRNKIPKDYRHISNGYWLCSDRCEKTLSLL